jgi:hypothetical protein
MKKTILMVVAVAGLSLLAVGQSDKKQAEKKQADTKQTDSAATPAQTARGSYDVKKQEGSIQESPEASEKKGVVHRDIAARDAQTGKATGELQTVKIVAMMRVDWTLTQPSRRSPRR